MSKANKSKDKHPSPYGMIEMEICRMWFEGYTSNEIESNLREMYPEVQTPIASTIRMWFGRGGKLHDYYEEYAETEATERQKEARNVFKSHVKNAVRVLVSIMNNKSEHTPSRVKAAEAVINRQMGEPIKPVANLNPKNPADRILQEIGVISKNDESREAQEDD